jgi:antitoxin MazE
MKTRIVKVGNSQGVRIPKALLEQSGLSGAVVLEVAGDSIVIRPEKRARAGWEAAFADMATLGEDDLLDEGLHDLPDEGWEW